MTADVAASPIPRHIPRLDVLRAFAILTVFAFHFFTITFHTQSVPWAGDARDYAAWPFGAWCVPLTWGWIGVALFFVLSGFCIHLSFLRKPGGFGVGDFYGRRFLRIYPAYLAALAAFSLFIFLFRPPGTLTAFQFVTHLLLVHNFSARSFFMINGAFWSLAVEFQFYLLYPLLLLGRSRCNLPICLAAALALNVLGQTILAWTVPLPYFSVDPAWSFPLMTWCGWILGACLAESFVRRERLFRHGWTWMGVAFVLFMVALHDRPLIGQSYLFAAVFFAAFMDVYLAWERPVTRVERLLIPIGLVSYSLYLWHQPLILPLDAAISNYLRLPHTPAWQVLVAMPLDLLLVMPITIASYFLIELGVPRLFRRSRRPGTAARPHPLATTGIAVPASPK
jgi:peptidoglycan/LPS O-acetylase OafA/YrhL